MGRKKHGCGIDGTWNSSRAWGPPYEGEMCGAEAAFSSLVTLLGQPILSMVVYSCCLQKETVV